RTSTAVDNVATCDLPPALSTICVLVGLPLTTNVPENPADALAKPSPTRSTFSSNCSSYLAAYAREVAALWARMTTNMATAVDISGHTCLQATSGTPKSGSPPGTGPSVDTPWVARSHCQLTMIDPMTAISAPGILGERSRLPTLTTITASDTARVAVLVSPMLASVPRNLRIVPPEPADTPSMPATCPIATWMPTPVRNPISTLRDRKSARKPRRNKRARMSSTPVTIASAPAMATYWGEASGAIPAMP